MTISDIVFFSQIDPKKFLKAEEPIAIYDTTGISNSINSMGQKFVVDYLMHQMPAYRLLAQLLLLYLPKGFERALVSLVRCLSNLIADGSRKGTMGTECIDDRFSTTRRLTRTPTAPDPCLQLPTIPAPKLVGGLRTRGLYKAEAPEPIVTVITIAYNCAAFIEETMLSVLNQTYSNIEYIVIDGGSTDGTLDVIRKYDHAIDYWISEPDRGIYDGINKGVRASTGQWLNCMNVKDAFASDDTVQTVADRYLNSGARFIYSDVLLTPCEQKNGNLRFKFRTITAI